MPASFSDSTSLHVMLGRLQCPYQVGGQKMCSFALRESYCPFGHRSVYTPSVIPPYICVDYLVGKCSSESVCNVSIELAYNRLTRCPDGFHPTWQQLMHLEELDQKVTAWERQQQVRQEQQQQPNNINHNNSQQCAICLEQIVSPYGLLEHCCHLFCAECIVGWEETDNQKRCPVCRVQSRRVLLWPNTDPIRNDQVKRELFRLQARLMGQQADQA